MLRAGATLSEAFFVQSLINIWLWINTYENTIFSGLFTSRNPSYFDVNRRGTIGFDTPPFHHQTPGHQAFWDTLAIIR